MTLNVPPVSKYTVNLENFAPHLSGFAKIFLAKWHLSVSSWRKYSVITIQFEVDCGKKEEIFI